MIKSLKKLMDGEGWVIFELALIGLAFLFYYITKKYSPINWYIIGIPLIFLGTGIMILIIIGIYKLIDLFKKKSRK